MGLAPYNIAYGFTATILAILFLVRLRTIIRYPGDISAKGMCLSFGFTALAFFFAAPGVYLAIDRAVGVSNLATLGVYVDILMTSVSFLGVLALWTGRTVPVKAWTASYLAVIVAMCALFAAGRTDDGEHPVDFDAHYAATPFISEFLLLYYAGFAVAMGGMAWLSLRYSRMAGRRWLVRGLRCTSVGAGFALGYCLLKVIAVVAIMAGVRAQAVSSFWAPLSATVGALLMGAGFTMPAWAPPVAEGVGRMAAHNRLYPLWRALTGVAPSVVLEPSTGSTLAAWTQRLSPRDVTHGLYRRVVEIHDARLALAPYLDPDAGEALGVRARDFGHDERRYRAAREAAMLIEAVRVKSEGGTARTRPYATVAEPGEEWGEQLGWLLLVAREFRTLSGGKERGRRPGAGRLGRGDR